MVLALNVDLDVYFIAKKMDILEVGIALV